MKISAKLEQLGPSEHLAALLIGQTSYADTNAQHNSEDSDINNNWIINLH